MASWGSCSVSALGLDCLLCAGTTSRAQRRPVCAVAMRRSHCQPRAEQRTAPAISISRAEEDGFQSQRSPRRRRRVQCLAAKTYTVEMIHDGVKHVLQVPEDETILSVALDQNLDVPHDCKLGVCMTCPARLEKGTVDQSGGMLSDDVIEQGFALMCVAYPRSDCTISTIPEEELLRLQLATAND